MMTDEITPALTAEAWAVNPSIIGSTRGAGGYRVSDGVDEYGDYTDIEDGCLHELAAVCLYGQPFGFTQADIDALLDVGAYTEANGTMPGASPFDETTLARIWSLRDRIAALLPPAP